MARHVRGSCEGNIKLEAHVGIPLILRYVPQQGWKTECCDVNHIFVQQSRLLV